MDNKFIGIGVMWLIIIFTYIMLGFFMPAILSIASEASAELDASANMSNFPGTKEVVGSVGVWIWFLPSLVGIIATIIYLKKE